MGGVLGSAGQRTGEKREASSDRDQQVPPPLLISGQSQLPAFPPTAPGGFCFRVKPIKVSLLCLILGGVGGDGVLAPAYNPGKHRLERKTSVRAPTTLLQDA